VNGSVRMTGFNLSTSPTTGYILTSDANGNGRWLVNAAAGSLWIIPPNTTDQALIGGNVGIGTTITTAGAALSVMNGNVGIGTWVPSRALEVEAGGTGTSLTSATPAAIGIHNVNTTAGNFADLAFSTLDTSGVSKLGSKISGVFVSHTAGAVSGDMAFTTMNSGAASEKMRITAAGNVGIGSVTPGQMLDVQGTVRAMAFIGNGAGLTNLPGNFSQWMTTNNTDVYLPNNGNVGIGTTVTTGAALTVMNGNVGIGSVTPGTLLDVQGSVRMTGFVLTANPSSGYVLTSDANGGGTWQNVDTLDPWTSSGDSVYLNNGLTNVGVGGVVPINTMDISGNTAIGINYAGLIGAPPNGLIVQGNVGIGSTAPGQKLDVFGTVRATAFVGNGANLTGLPVTSSQWTTTNTNDVYLPNKGNVGLGTTITGGAALSIMNGNVGIGTWAPGMMLDVKGTVRATSFVGNGSLLTGLPASTNWTNTNANDVYLPISGNVGIGTTITNAGAALSVMNGNVGIGTWVPSRALEVEASSTATSLTSASAAAIGIHNLNNATPGNFADLAFSTLDSNGASKLGSKISGVFQSHTAGSVSGDMAFTTMNSGAASEKMRITAAGNVGIGSVTPGQSLDVNGTVRAMAFIGNGAGLTGLGVAAGWTTTNTNDVYETNGGNVGIGTTITGGAALSIMNGNVGIGTWAPSSTFDIVNGSIAVTYTTKTANYTATANDHIILVDATSGAVTITLPQASTVPGREYFIKKIDASANAVIISGYNGTEQIDGQTTISTTLEYQSYTLICVGTQWFII